MSLANTSLPKGTRVLIEVEIHNATNSPGLYYGRLVSDSGLLTHTLYFNSEGIREVKNRVPQENEVWTDSINGMYNKIVKISDGYVFRGYWTMLKDWKPAWARPLDEFVKGFKFHSTIQEFECALSTPDTDTERN